MPKRPAKARATDATATGTPGAASRHPPGPDAPWTGAGAPVGGRRKPAGQGPSTLAVHAGEASDPRSGAINVPIQQSTTFRFPEMEDGEGRLRPSPYIYS